MLLVSSQFTATTVALVVSAFCLIPVAWSTAAAADDESAIKVVMSDYQDALNASSTDRAMALYTDDGVVMPPYSQSVVGKSQLRKLYEAGSKTFRLNVKFAIREIFQISPEWAFVRTQSSGTSKMLATGATHAEANQELFILHKGGDGAWKIARYSFSSTNPPPRP